MNAQMEKPPTGLASDEAALKTQRNQIIGEAQPIDKELDTLRAQFAIRGHALFVIDRPNGARFFEVRRWGFAKTCSTLHDLKGFLTQIGGDA